METTYMDQYRHLSVPDFYQYQPFQIISDIVYTVSPEHASITSQKFDEEILEPITSMVSSNKSKRVTRKKHSKQVKPVLKIY